MNYWMRLMLNLVLLFGISHLFSWLFSKPIEYEMAFLALVWLACLKTDLDTRERK